MLLKLSELKRNGEKSLNVQLGRSFRLKEFLRNLRHGFPKFLILDANEEIIDIFSKNGRVPSFNIEFREKGILLWFKSSSDYQLLGLPYYSLSLFKGSDYLKLYSGKWFVKIWMKENAKAASWLMKEIMAQKARIYQQNSMI